jgi:twitching motility protein PilT
MPDGPAIDKLFQAMCAAGASDLHLSVGSPPIIRKDGRMQPLDPAAAALGADDLIALLQPIIPERNREEFGRRHDTDFAYEIPDLARFRANAFVDRRGPGAVFRVIHEAYAKAVDKTGFEALLKPAGLDARPRPQPAAV